MRWLPDSALARSALLIALALILSQLAASLLMRGLLFGPAVEQMASLVADNASLLDALLARTPPAEHNSALRRLQRERGLRLDLSPAGPPGGEPFLFYQRAFAALLRARLGEDAALRVQRERETVLWVRPRPESPYWLGMTARRLEQGVPGIFLLWGLVLVAIAGGGGLIVAQVLNLHLSRLAALAARVGRGDLPERFAADGPREIRALGEALERMARDVRQLADDRALLLAGISHDLRTPLARIRLSLEMLGAADPEIRDGIAEDVDEMDAIIGQFIATIRDGHDETPAPADLNAIIQETCARIARVRTAPTLTLGPMPVLPLRPMAMGRLLNNLLENAHRHGAEPVAITSRGIAGAVRIQVLDRGPGVPEVEIPTLFRPFARGRTQGAGSGLGLVIARRIARLHGGELTLHNRPDGGLEARVELPVQGRWE